MKKIVPVVFLLLAGTAGFAQTHNTVPGTPLYALDIIWDELDTRYRYRTFEVDDGWGGFPAYRVYTGDPDYFRGFTLRAKGTKVMKENPIGEIMVMLDGNGGLDAGLIVLAWYEDEKTLGWFQFHYRREGEGGDWSR